MTERPILFNDEMVRAILDGSKTQTRRPMRPQPCAEFLARGVVAVVPQWPQQDGMRWFMADGLSELVKSPWKPGDRHWVRECWGLKTGTQRDHSSRVFYRADGADRIEYWQNGNHVPETYGYGLSHRGKWRPSIHMPRWASRITLEVLDVRAQRLGDISHEDAIAEGAEDDAWLEYEDWVSAVAGGVPHVRVTLREHFTEVWDSIYAKKGLGSADNPWVFAGTFKRIEL